MTAFLIAFLMLMLSFFFSGMEIAFISSNLLKIELKTKQGDRAAKILSGFKKQVPAVIITILIGNNLALVVFTLMVNDITEPWLTQGLGLSPDSFFLIFTFIQAVIATLIILFFAEYIPKAIFRRNADTLVYPFAYVLQLFFWILRLPVW
ncbi:MAG: CNNM domain-containing protein, partial [Bacteroidota bacterium]